MSKQVIVEIEDAMAEALERVAPARSRQRSAFIRAALQRALDEAGERRLAEAYRAQPDAEPAYFDARVWEGPAAGASPPRRAALPRPRGRR